MNRLYILPLALLLLSIAAACRDESNAPTATPTDGPSSETPTPAPVPGLFIVDPATGQGTSATPGTRCWADTCIDYIGPVTGDKPVGFNAGAALAWQAEGGTVDAISHAWVPVADAESEITSNGTRLWRMLSADFAEGDITVPAQPGTYVLLVFTTYTNGGDVSWGVYITVA